MVAAYLMVVFAVDLGWPHWLSFLLALAGMALLGAIFNLGGYYPLRHRTFLPVIIATVRASMLLAKSVLALYGPQPQLLDGCLATPAARSSGGWRSPSSKPLARPIFRFPPRTVLPFSCWCCFWCSGLRASSANASRRKHERPQRKYAGGDLHRARKTAVAPSSAVFHRRRDRRRTRRDHAVRRLHPQHPDGSHDLCDRGVRSLRRARPVRADQSGAGGIFRPCPLCLRLRPSHLSSELLAVSCRRLRDRAAGRRLARHVDTAAPRALSGD